jgi:tRNA A-37 threonylcarbamoyl transferase component Bud32
VTAIVTVNPLRAGDRLGDYEVDVLIASGGMGAVYRARAHDGRAVAIKQLTDPRQSTRFEIEARLLARLEHPRVARVIDHFEADRGMYLVMELVEGTDLGQLRQEEGGRLPVGEALEYGLQACEALQYVHEQQIVHRDVKPQNLIVGPQGVVLVDFGIAREVDEEDPGTRAVGTPQYMAPEVIVGEEVSPRCDVYGLAATLWTLIAGKAPAFHDPTRLSERFDDVTPELEGTLRAGLELQPERRVASAAALARALGSPLGVSSGASLALSLAGAANSQLQEAIVRAAAGVFEAAAASIALVREGSGELVYETAWGAGAHEVVGVRLPPGVGIAGSAVEAGEGVAVADCRKDPRFAQQIAKGTGYVPHTMLVVPLKRDGVAIGALSVLDRRDGGSYGSADLVRARLFADLAVVALP